MVKQIEQFVLFGGYQAYVFIVQDGVRKNLAVVDFVSDGVVLIGKDGCIAAFTRNELEYFMHKIMSTMDEVEELVEDWPSSVWVPLSWQDGLRKMLKIVILQPKEGRVEAALYDRIEAFIVEAGKKALSKLSTNNQSEDCVQPPNDLRIYIAPEANLEGFIEQMSKQFFEIGDVLKRGWELGVKIPRRPLKEFLNGIERDGIVRAEFQGCARYVDGNLQFYPDGRILETRIGKHGGELGTAVFKSGERGDLPRYWWRGITQSRRQ